MDQASRAKFRRLRVSEPYTRFTTSENAPVRADLERWVEELGLDPAVRHASMRRTKATLVYRRTKNVRAVQLLLAHSKLESTVRYLTFRWTIVPEPTHAERAECRRKARALSGGSGWLAQVLDHHEQVNAAFQAVRDAATAPSMVRAQKWLDVADRPLDGPPAMPVHREESDWFPELCNGGDATVQSKLSRRYKEEFERYIGSEVKA